MIKELTKIKLDKGEVSKKLDHFAEKGILPTQIQEFNDLCREEFILSVKEKLLERKPGDNSPMLPPRIQRKITIISVPVKNNN